MTAAAQARAIDDEVSALIATLPDLPEARLAALEAAAHALAAQLDGEVARLATTLATLTACYREGRAVLEGWGIVASSAHTLARAVAGPGSGQAAAVAAARFELETLLPRTGAPAPTLATPDVPIASRLRKP